MAFVFRSEVKGTYIPKTQPVGPGQYDYKIEQDAKPYNHPFNSTVQRQQKANEIVPGPGTYNLQSSFDCQKVIFQSDEQEIKILEVPKPISVFRSTTLRFKEDKADVPGPTQYFVEERRKFHSAGQPNRQRKIQILEQLVKDNKYISIPSIPSNVHQGYTENKDNQLEQNPIDLSNDVGPGSYDFQSTFGKVKGVQWHKGKEKKEIKSSIGPGYYDVASQSQPMYQMKPTTAFSSKLNRYSDFRQNTVKSNTGYIKKGLDKKNYSFNLSTNAGTTARDTDDESEYSYIEDATPGPGYYESTQQTISQVLNQSKMKGTLKTRTKRFHSNSQHTPGPGSYQLEVVAQRHQGPKPPFLGGTNRFEQQISETPAPGTYKPKNTIEDKLINRLLKAPLGQFGVNETRFRETKPLVPGPGTYDKVEEEKKVPDSKGSPSFLSHVPKIQELQAPNINPAPGAYNVVHHTIAHKIIKPEEDDPKLAVIKPPFGTGAERWKIQEPIAEVDDEDAYIHERSPKQDFVRKRKKDPPAFMSKEDRFSKSLPKNNNIPGPADYADGMYPNWNRRTFNIIFAEI